MAGKNDQFAELNRKSMDAALKLAQLSFENAQRMMALQSDLAKVMFQSGVDNARAQASASDPQELMQLRSQYAQQMTQRMVATAQQIAEIGNAARTEFTQLMTEQLASGSPDMTSQMQAFMKNMPGQTPHMMEAFQKTIASATSAFDQFSKASAQSMSQAAGAAKKPAGGKRK